LPRRFTAVADGRRRELQRPEQIPQHQVGAAALPAELTAHSQASHNQQLCLIFTGLELIVLALPG
jgi:hypothetical protein